ncbi:hypothetical protein NQ317_003813 [Molorchus minor]|uniref:Major facilitator superfamily (MFS) profile domain-containing protein n=1 Tax=Molorchus minor TaxID=1323400 RepID=A0ABQ9JG87_9CUCU|nr:hypothetical protein NQ317_003813 [Molorchus minor]
MSKLQDIDDTPFDQPLSSEEASWISSLLALGAVFGPFIYGFLADKIGRKYTLLTCGVPILVCYFLLAFGKVPAIFYAARFIIGLSVGGVFTVMPMYIGEIAEDSNRGSLGSAMNCFLCAGLLFSYSLGPYVSILAFNLVLAVFPAIFLVVFFIVSPESPHYYISRNNIDSAKSALLKLRRGDEKIAEGELSDVQTKMKDEGKGSFFDIFRSKGLTKAFIISASLVAFQQLSGINAVLFYAQNIFKQAGTSLEPAVCSIIVGGVQFGTSFVTPLIVDKLGRKVLLTASAVGMIISEIPLGVYSYLKDHDNDVSSIKFVPILSLISYIIMYNCGSGPLPWAVMGELFPSKVKSIASSATTAKKEYTRANIGTFAACTALTWSSPVISKLEDAETTPFSKALTSEETSWISALLPLGAVFGPFLFGYLADKIGRKYTLLTCGAPVLISYLILAFSKTAILYYVARFLTGMSVGGVFTVLPIYVGEIAEDSNRGALGSSMNCFITAGLTFSYCVGPYVSITLFNVILAIFPCVFLILFFMLGYESPHYYVSNQKHDEAKFTLQKIRGTEAEKTDIELLDIQTKIKEEGNGRIADIFKSKGLIKAFSISVGLLAFQQFSGINAILFYAQNIFEEAGTSLKPEICSILIGVVQFLASFVTPLIVDRLGRKVLLIFSGVGMAVSELPLGVYVYLNDHDHDVSSISFLPILCLIVYIITYNVGFGPLPWTIMGELFPSNVKSSASSLSAAICWFLGFLIAKYFESISASIGMGPSFWIFGSCCMVSIPFCLLYVIETKGKSLQEIQNALNG